MKLWILSMLVLIFLFCTVRLPAQTAGGTAQVSPVANLSGSNASVVNNNFQMVQNGINVVLYEISQYFPGGILQTSMGGTGLNLSAATSTGDTLMATGNGTIGLFQPGTSGYYLQSQGAGNYPEYVPISVPKTLIGTWQDNVGAQYTNNGAVVINTVVINSGTDWAGKNILIIGYLETELSDSFNTSLSGVLAASSTTIATSYSANSYKFAFYPVTLPTNSYTALLGINTHTIGIGTNSLGNLCLYSIANINGIAGGGSYVAYSQIAGAILRTP